jgi:cytochrome c biogenesis protein CcdA/thiol-disulfide isomerase/thioredoxin
MILACIVFLAGVLTILSPCILPVLPFVFTRADRPFSTNGLPMLIGMAITFAGVATLAAVGGAWVVQFNQFGRALALVLLAAFAATLLSRRLADALARPFVALGNRLIQSEGAAAGRDGIVTSLLLGVATGLLWAPCAGPILGLLLTGAALSGPTPRTTLLLLAYAAGSATSLAVALLAGGRIVAALKRTLGAGEWVRRALGVAVLAAVAGIALGWDGNVLTRLSQGSTDRLEQSLLAYQGSGGAMAAASGAGAVRPSIGPGAASAGIAPGAAAPAAALPVSDRETPMPSLAGATGWLNSPPLTRESLRGKVVLVDFWTYSCINCLRTLPYVKRWYQTYQDHGLVVIGVHAPEFAFERDPDNVRRAVGELGITYPVAIDDNYAIWRGFSNQYWPAHYFIDAEGRIRGQHFGEGDYDGSERTIRELLTQAGYKDLPPSGTAPAAAGVEAAPDMAHISSEETYIGYRRADGFRSPGGFADDRPKSYALPSSLQLNEWGLFGRWTDDAEKAVLDAAPGKIQFRFLARDLHLVLGPGGGKPVRFRVRLDGLAPGANHGVDTDAEGNGVIREQRLYQLIRQTSPVAPHTFSIEFLDEGAQAYSFTFG